jgi:hypothetical protein
MYIPVGTTISINLPSGVDTFILSPATALDGNCTAITNSAAEDAILPSLIQKDLMCI